MTDHRREIWIDWLRVTACFLVMMTHACEPFYLGGEGSLILTESDALWVSFLNVLPRACVALFIVASSYLQFPLHYSTGEFFKRRAKRILIPFLFWTVVYALVWGEPVQNFKDLLLNFNYAAGHMWFVYMIIGLYLIMPLLSPWAEKVGKRELQVYLGIWLFTTLIPLIRQLVGGPAPVIYGPSGIPNAAKFPLWGEASWNAYGVFYYLSGFVGYMLLGLYFRKFVGELSWGRTLGIALPVFLAGFAICTGGFLGCVWADCHGVFPIEGPVGLAALWEGPWLNDTFGVALMTIGWILVSYSGRSAPAASSTRRCSSRSPTPATACTCAIFSSWAPSPPGSAVRSASATTASSASGPRRSRSSARPSFPSSPSRSPASLSRRSRRSESGLSDKFGNFALLCPK